MKRDQIRELAEDTVADENTVDAEYEEVKEEEEKKKSKLCHRETITRS